MKSLVGSSQRTFFLALLLIPFSSPTLADPHPMALGGVAGPVTRPVEIAMRKETLDVAVSSNRAEVAADIDLENTGPERALSIGFPCERGDHAGVLALDCTTPITVTVDGKPVKTRVQRADGKEEYVWPMKFAAGAKTKLKIAYKARLRNDRYKVPIHGSLALLYRLTTGAQWAGPIGTLDMNVTLPADAVAFIRPAGYTRTPRHIKWHLSDYEPSEELTILFVPEVLGSLSDVKDQLAKVRGQAREQLVTKLRTIAARLGRDAKAAEHIHQHILPLFHIPPPPNTEIVKKTLVESAQLIEAELSQ